MTASAPEASAFSKRSGRSPGAKSSERSLMSVHSSVGCVPILKFGTEEQRQRFLPKLASGEWIGGFALTEPQAGSDASNLKTRARRDGDHYVIDGSKQFITSGKNGNVIIAFAVTDPDVGKKGITAFIVQTDTPGYEVIRVEEKLGLHSSDTCQIAFNSMKNLLFNSVVAACCILPPYLTSPGNAQATDWGCEVVLCLSNPGGPTQFAEWRELAEGHSFPT